MNRELSLQAVILGACMLAAALWVWHFPYPSPLLKPFLPADLRWPTQQVVDWARNGNPDADFLSYFMRDPDRTTEPGYNAVAPVDGTVLGIHERDGIRYAVLSLSVWDVHVARSPFDGVVTAISEGGVIGGSREAVFYWLDGKPAPAFKRIEIATSEGTMIYYLVTSLLATRIQLEVELGDTVARGQRVGRMLFGSTAIVGMPDRFQFLVKEGERVVGGETVIVDWKR